ncbi:MAG TPA: hypothetical protein VK787_08310, partial [Puia sp.]|nr:hypothetical protein [Puia sp.]
KTTNMKKLFFFAGLICFFIATANAQLAGTKWTGDAHLLQSDGSLITVGITWNFEKDTVSVLFAGGGEPEVLTYSTQKNVLTLVKVSGGSPCDTGASGELRYDIKDDKLFLKVVKSNCEAFTKALDDKPYTRVK